MTESPVLRLPNAPLGRRALAILLDVALSALLALAVTFFLAVATRSPQPVGPGAAFVVLLGAALAVHLLAPLRWQATPGMRATGLKIVADEDLPPQPIQIGLRGVIAAITLAGLLPIPFQIISVLFDPDRRSSSDWLSGTRVVLDPDRDAA
jgi:uncharacterized RDD family membrane protein YckC